jgi:flagellar protein FliO/FliZ
MQMTIRELVPVLAMLALASLAPSVSVAADTPIEAVTWWSLFAPLVFVLAAGVGLLWLIRRRFAGAMLPNGPLRVVQVVPIGTRERLLLLEHDGRRLICGVTAHAVSFTELGASGAIAPPGGERQTSP